jgi:ribokinase
LPPSVCVVGSINLDLVTTCKRLPRAGETVTGGVFRMVPGGKGANQAVAAARLGAEVRMIGAVGRDAFAEPALAELDRAGVDIRRIKRVDEQTGVATILVDETGENEIVVSPGANHTLVGEDVDGAEDGDYDAHICQLEIPDDAIASTANWAEHFFCLNAAPARPVPAEILGQADLVVVNRYELDALAEMPHLVALTLGAEGAVLLEDGEEVVRAAPPAVKAVDGTAAGDAFTACLVVSLLEGREREEALRRACAAGAIAASRRGAQPSLPTTAEVDEILRA